VTVRYENPPDRGFNKASIILGLIVFITAIVVSLLAKTALTRGAILFIGILGGCAFPLIIWRREYYMRPTFVEVKSEGVRLEWKYHRPRDLLWDDIVGVSIARSGERDYLNLSPMGIGAVVFKKGPMRFMTVEICDAVALAYRENTGEVLPLVPQGEDERVFRKRILKSRKRR
jgi:hypothetical protein